MTYHLYRAEHIDADPQAPSLGEYDDFDAALAARDRDVIAQLERAPVPPREITHLIIGPGFRGRRTRHPLVTFAGTTVTDPDPAAEVAATAAWLDVVRGR
jgi:hypothetical protein